MNKGEDTALYFMMNRRAMYQEYNWASSNNNETYEIKSCFDIIFDSL